MKRIDVFDSLRGIAIIGVILIHSGNNVPRNFGVLAEAVISNGNKGVQIFLLFLQCCSIVPMFNTVIRVRMKG